MKKNKKTRNYFKAFELTSRSKNDLTIVWPLYKQCENGNTQIGFFDIPSERRAALANGWYEEDEYHKLYPLEDFIPYPYYTDFSITSYNKNKQCYTINDYKQVLSDEDIKKYKPMFIPDINITASVTKVKKNYRNISGIIKVNEGFFEIYSKIKYIGIEETNNWHRREYHLVNLEWSEQNKSGYKSAIFNLTFKRKGRFYKRQDQLKDIKLWLSLVTREEEEDLNEY